METLITILAGILVTVATYLILSKSLIRVILGTAILSHAAHLLIITMAGLKNGSVPIIGEGDAIPVDPLPQALILTSIVISFAVTAVSLVLAYRTYQETGTDKLDELRGDRNE
ncbi:Na(+)/H(+) antiporter subunit C [Oceanobacillus kimchii]|uniref:Na(+)/H(+) antiporter subunit C n=1 Tax=Oceanobacillus kimchii TaxID=746691 RepID=A0ABQ5TSA8_9BACI|nr:MULTISPECIES: Na(+)/H(+) antiporter subunit C [Oceanobacillus]MBT2599572.1 Na(+)/H(+) antiporter subunit C [Oceanobacillus sp. ISL-74]MCT1576757.1 Na(+)/H(+) antiporter subunit C [Oceanobacillus kimchii]MCT2134827.1 Na(+)/H(+) antiporter subunit C [Oceanobacillus kimchii]OEH56122.1 cation:proton antiporter [Oceanobacillus sp. E9]GLO67797.1 Na(+)/H(+) antiporter subunit C [Oceanobacillus kimchii]